MLVQYLENAAWRVCKTSRKIPTLLHLTRLLLAERQLSKIRQWGNVLFSVKKVKACGVEKGLHCGGIAQPSCRPNISS